MTHDSSVMTNGSWNILTPEIAGWVGQVHIQALMPRGGRSTPSTTVHTLRPFDEATSTVEPVLHVSDLDLRSRSCTLPAWSCR